MAESGVQDSSLSAGSEPVFDIVCQPCSSDGKHAEAEAYCMDCCEHLCGQCIKDHRKFSTMKHHQLVDKEAMPGTQDDLQVRDVCNERCPDHREEIIKFFCPDHDDLACRDCVTLHHKTCDLDYIKDVAEDRSVSFISELEEEDLTEQPEMVTLALENKQKSVDCHANTIQDLDVFRDKLVDAVDRSIHEMKDYSGHIFSQDTERMDKIVAMGSQFMDELRSMRDDFIGLREKKRFCKIFVEMKCKEKRLTDLQRNIEYFGGSNPGVTTYSFQPNQKLPTALCRQGGLGKLLLTACEAIEAVHATDINVKTKANEYTCKVTGISMVSENCVVVADNRNGTIKLINMVNDNIISELLPEACPYDVAVSNDTIAATLSDANKIVFLKHNKGLVYDRDINVAGRCKGIDWYNDKLYVAFGDDKKIEVMTTAGVVLQKFTTTDKEELFSKPKYVTVNAINKNICVSDYNKNQLIILDMDGKPTVLYDNDELRGPTQPAIDRTGMMFLCDYGSDTVHLLSPYGEKVKILLTKDDDDFEDPYSLGYCKDTRRLYVGMESDTVKVYQIS